VKVLLGYLEVRKCHLEVSKSFLHVAFCHLEVAKRLLYVRKTLVGRR
jgi:hypothetical protein